LPWRRFLLASLQLGDASRWLWLHRRWLWLWLSQRPDTGRYINHFWLSFLHHICNMCNPSNPHSPPFRNNWTSLNLNINGMQVSTITSNKSHLYILFVSSKLFFKQKFHFKHINFINFILSLYNRYMLFSGVLQISYPKLILKIMQIKF